MLFTAKKLAALTIAALAPAAGAAVIYFPGANIPIPTTFAGVSVDFETGATTNDLGGAPGMDLNFALGGEAVSNDADETAPAPSAQFVRVGATSADPIDNLTVGTVVDGSSPTASDFGGSSSHFPPFTSGDEGYIGFEFEIAGPTTAYGWARVTFNDDNTPGVIHEWAYEDTGAPIAVGTIPEPSLPLLATLGLAVIALRRRR